MKTYFMFLIIGLVSGNAQARMMGPSTGGGGFTVSCPATPVSTALTELLDIYEGREVLNFTMAVAVGDLFADYLAAVDRTYTAQGHPDLAQQTSANHKTNLTRFFQSVKFVENAAEMPVANDLGDIPWIPSMCELKQVAFFDDVSGIIYILRPLFAEMDSMNQSALVHHELFYREYRKMKDKTSKFARRAVSHVYAVRGPTPLMEGARKSDPKYSALELDFLKSGETLLSDFYVVSFPASGIQRLQFDVISGRPQLTRAFADVPLVNWNLKYQRSSTIPDFTGCLVQTPGLKLDHETAMQGTMVDGLKLRYHVETGEPVRLTLVSGNEILSELYVDAGASCKAH